MNWIENIDLPIFDDFNQSVESLRKIGELSNISYICPAWDDVYDEKKAKKVISNSKDMLMRSKNAAIEIDKKLVEADENEKMLRTLEKMDMVQYMGNPLVAKSIKVCLELNRK